MTRIAAIALIVAIAVAGAFAFEMEDVIVTPEFANVVSSKATTWVASHEQGAFFKGATKRQLKTLMGAKLGGSKLPKKDYSADTTVPPASFDSAAKWPQCATITQIRDQSACGSCWAFGAAESISDRYCTYTNVNLTLSAVDLVACCSSCGDGCNGGYPSAAYDYWTQTGLVEEACDPYPFPKCEHHITGGQYPPCPAAEYPNPTCQTTCKNGASWTKHKGTRSWSLSGEAAFMKELSTNGPIEITLTVYEDFLTYKSGVYSHVTGAALGGHAVRLVGYGVLNGVKYWKVANSWNVDWGANGYFLIKRGTDECGIEEDGTAGQP